jgi:hypothetical protein
VNSNSLSISLIIKYERTKKLNDVCKQHMACETATRRDEVSFSNAREVGNITLVRLVGEQL